MSDRKLFIELAEALQDRQDNQIDILKLHSERLEALHGVLAALADVVKDIRARMLTRGDFNAGMLRHDPGTFEEAERVMAGEDDCHLAKIKRGEAEAPIGGQSDD